MPVRALTVAQVRRRRCWRCKSRRGHATWAVCADGNTPRVLCARCDLSLNRLVLRWARDARRGKKLAAYAAQLRADGHRV